MMTIVNTALWYTGKLLKVNPRILITRRIFFFFYLGNAGCYMRCWMLAKPIVVMIFTIYVNQTSMLYDLSLYGDTGQSSSVQSLSCVQVFVTPWIAARQAFLSITNSWSLLKPCPLSQWCHPTISSSVVPFSSCHQSFAASGSFQMSQFFTSGGQSFGVSASTSVLPINV